MGLIKGARGLPKLTIACGWWRHPRWVGAGLDEMGLFVACLSYCYEHATDGRLPGADPEDLAVALGVKARQAKPALAALIARGSLIQHADGFEIRNFAIENPTRAEIHASREQRSAAGKKSAEARWGKRDADDDTCDPLCDPLDEPDATRVTPPDAKEENVENGTESTYNTEIARSSSDAVAVVFDAWKDATGHHRSVLDRRRRDLIRRRLADYDVDDLTDACRGVVLFAHNRGETNGTRYDSIELVLRDAEHIERFRDRYRGESAPAPRLPRGSDMTVRNLERLEGRRGTA